MRQRRLRHGNLWSADFGLLVLRSASDVGCTCASDGCCACTSDHHACPEHQQQFSAVDAGPRARKCFADEDIPGRSKKAFHRHGVETDPADRHPIELDAGAGAARSERPDSGSVDLYIGSSLFDFRACLGFAGARQRRLGSGEELNEARQTGVFHRPARPAGHVAVGPACFLVAAAGGQNEELFDEGQIDNVAFSRRRNVGVGG